MDPNTFAQEFAKAQADDDARRKEMFAALEPGKYQVKLEDAFRNTSQSGRPQVVFCWKVLEGEKEGKDHRQYFGLDNSVGLSILNSALRKLTYDTANMSLESLDEICKHAASHKPVCVITLKQKGEYTNTSVNDFLGFSEDDDVPDQPAEAPWEAGIGATVKFESSDGSQLTGEIVGLDEEAGNVQIKYEGTLLDVPTGKVLAKA